MSLTRVNSGESPAPTNNVPLQGGVRLKGVISQDRADQPLVTVITAVYNGNPYIAGCLDSVLSQDYSNIEHIVLDGGSSDGTVEMLRQYSDQLALWKSEPDEGVYDAWNKALLEARGEWICFLGADDEFVPGAVSAYMKLAAKNPNAEYLSSRVRVVYSTGYERILGEPWTWSRFSKSMCTAHVGSMHRRSLFDRLGVYDTTYRSASDYELLLRARHGLRADYMPIVTAKMRAGGLSLTYAAIEEEARAKMSAGGRNRVLTALELYLAKVKFPLRIPRAALAKRARRAG